MWVRISIFYKFPLKEDWEIMLVRPFERIKVVEDAYLI
jgi:predicted PilT family ATPase